MNDSDTRPRRTCDVVMKGGITSGVVYPQAITTLAKRYTFKNIGGTSAGAIAAAAAAAAEYRRQFSGSDAGFQAWAGLPGMLGEKPGGGLRTRLFLFFQPNVSTKRIFEVATTGLGVEAGALNLVLRKIMEEYAGWSCVGTFPGLALGIVSASQISRGPIAWLWLLVSLLLILAGAAISAVAAFALDFIREVPRNGYGLCSGLSDASFPLVPSGARHPLAKNQPEPLTNWLTRYLNETAGLEAKGDPLTFGHLWGTSESDVEKAPHRITLEMMTTNLTHGRPYRLPFRDDFDLKENTFYFRPDEFQRLFPAEVVEWMVKNPRDKEIMQGIISHPDDPKYDPQKFERRLRLEQMGFLPFPAPADLPVVVATRMSLSFPILLSAVPLHSIDRSVFSDNEQPERCWFSDGGMCSNFPLHFFDTALPRRPTFSIDLTEKPDSTPKDTLVPEMDQQNTDRIREFWNRFDTEIPEQAGEVPKDKPDLDRLLGFFAAAIATMQNWTDATQGRLPGYRDRIVRVPLTSKEGGLNLDMPPERIRDLTVRGVLAAELLIEHFDVPPEEAVMTWDNHRWIRLRAFLASLEKSLCQLVATCDAPENEDEGYEQWLADLQVGRKAPSYRMNKNQLAAAIETLKGLRAILNHWDESPAAHEAPRPRPVLRPRAQI